MYPNPFTVTGGEPGRDWIYDEASHTLHILSAQVTAIAGGTGVDARKEAFSGRIALADGIGAVELALDGVVCRVSSGRAFRLGRGNDVTLLLQNGTDNLFESGAGCAGISLGDGTSLRIDCADRPEAGEDPAGTLDATIGVGAQGAQSDILTMEMGKDTVTWPQFCLPGLAVGSAECVHPGLRPGRPDHSGGGLPLGIPDSEGLPCPGKPAGAGAGEAASGGAGAGCGDGRNCGKRGKRHFAPGRAGDAVEEKLIIHGQSGRKRGPPPRRCARSRTPTERAGP